MFRVCKTFARGLEFNSRDCHLRTSMPPKINNWFCWSWKLSFCSKLCEPILQRLAKWFCHWDFSWGNVFQSLAGKRGKLKLQIDSKLFAECACWLKLPYKVIKQNIGKEMHIEKRRLLTSFLGCIFSDVWHFSFCMFACFVCFV